MQRPYVGVTGFTTPSQVRDAVACWESQKSSHALMCGFLARPVLSRSDPLFHRYVSDPKTIPDLFALAGAQGIPALHYVVHGYEDRFAEHLLPILHDLDARKFPLTVQLNGRPAVREVQKIRSAFPQIRLIFQVVPELIAAGPSALVQNIAEYGSDTFSYILLDPSCGMGIDLVVEEVMPFAVAIQKAFPKACLGFAGGFDGSNAAQRIRAISAAISGDFCIDAEGKLFSSNSFDMAKVKRYLESAAEACAST